MASRPMEQGNFRGPAPQQPESTSVIDQYSNFDGTYDSARDLRVEGQVKGTIVCKGTLHVAQGANVRAAVEAEAISVAGELDGEINCRGRLELLPTGRVKGQIATQTLVIHEGAVYEGDLEMGGTAGRSRRNRPVVERSESVEASTAPTAQVDAPVAEEPIAEAPVGDADAPATRPNSFIRRFGTQDASAPTNAPEATDK